MQFLKKLGIAFLVITFLAFVVTMVFSIWKFSTVDCNREYGIAELIYYTSQVIAMFATSAAVIIALFGNEIRNLFFHEHLKIFLTNSGISENLGLTRNNPNPQVQNYDCFLTLTNDGSKEITDCQILLKEVHYKDSADKKFKRIHSFENKALYWSSPETTYIVLLINDSRKIPLFKIYPDDSCQTPDNSLSASLRMRIIGCTLNSNYCKKGVWKTVYQVRAEDKILKTFELTFEWDGVWCNRYSEMSERVSVKLNEKN